MMFHDFFWGSMWFGWIFWIGIIALFVWALSNSSNRRHPTHLNFPQQETPLDILKRRYAKGEITKEQFDQMKKDISA